MLSGQNDVVAWVEDTEQDDAVSYPHPNHFPHAVSHFPHDCHDWYATGSNLINTPLPLLPPPHHHQTTSFFPPFINPFDPATSFNFPPDHNFLGPGPDLEFSGGMGFSGLESFDPTPARKMLVPLDMGSVPGSWARPTLFEKRVLGKRRREAEEEEEGSFGGTMVNYYDSENENNNGGGSEYNYEYGEGNSKANSGVTGGGGGGGGGGEVNTNGKGKRKGGIPAKNLMAERRRRKKLNDRLYMLRSVVPKISKVRDLSSFSFMMT